MIHLSFAYGVVVFSYAVSRVFVFLHNELLFDLKHRLNLGFEYVVDVNLLIYFVVVVVDRISMQ